MSSSGKNRRKGNLVEDITAWLHQEFGLSIQKRVLIGTRHKDGRKREIDVLLSRSVAGYPVRIAIECKNQRKPVGSPIVDSFLGKLDDVGIPPTHGIIVSASGFTKHALKRGVQSELRLLELAGLSEDRLRADVAQCFQSLVYLMALVERVELKTTISEFEPPGRAYAFYGQDREYRGFVFDLIWKEWMDGEVPRELGTHSIIVPVPEDYLQIGKEGTAAPLSVTARVKVIALAMRQQGDLNDLSLVNSDTGQSERRRLLATFPDDASGLSSIVPFEKVEDLKKYLGEPAVVAVSTITLPRIVALNKVYWPLRRSTADKLQSLAESGDQIESLVDIEGSGLAAIWEEFAA